MGGIWRTAIELANWMDERFDLPKFGIHDIYPATPEAAASVVRQEWLLGEQPIGNLVHLLESRGVRVFSFGELGREVDAFSFWYGTEMPVVFLNTQKSPERVRFDASHELGHLVLHGRGIPKNGQAETEADAFASAFLMPQAGVVASTRRNASVPEILQWKRTWGVSAMALAYRMNRLGMLSEWEYRNVCIKMSRAGYRRTEPDSMPRETSQLLTKVFKALRDEGTSKADIARDLALFPREIDALTFGLVMGAVPFEVAGAAPTSMTDGGGLRLIDRADEAG